MDALNERRVGDIQLLGAGPQFQARCLQHGAHAAIQQDGIGPVKQQSKAGFAAPAWLRQPAPAGSLKTGRRENRRY